jgi:hypothetical protein
VIWNWKEKTYAALRHFQDEEGEWQVNNLEAPVTLTMILNTKLLARQMCPSSIRAPKHLSRPRPFYPFIP